MLNRFVASELPYVAECTMTVQFIATDVPVIPTTIAVGVTLTSVTGSETEHTDSSNTSAASTARFAPCMVTLAVLARAIGSVSGTIDVIEGAAIRT